MTGWRRTLASVVLVLVLTALTLYALDTVGELHPR